jgi:hypothetical protein
MCELSSCDIISLVRLSYYLDLINSYALTVVFNTSRIWYIPEQSNTNNQGCGSRKAPYSFETQIPEYGFGSRS